MTGMDAPNPSALPTFASRTPLHIGAISLKVRDLEALVAFYRDALGLSVVRTGEDGAALGAGGVPFVRLEADAPQTSCTHFRRIFAAVKPYSCRSQAAILP